MRSTFEVVITADHPIVGNHRVLDRPLLPGLAYIDLLYQLARQGLGVDCHEYSLHKLSLLQPLLIDNGAAVRLKIAFEGDADSWDISVGGVEEGATSAEERTYATAQLSRGKSTSAQRLDIEALKQAATRKVDMAEIYTASAARGLVHGGLIRARGEIFVSERGCLIELSAQREDGPHGLLFHPAIIDGAAMAAEALRSYDDPALFLPLYYESFACSEPLGTQCFAFIDAASVRSVNDINSLDIAFYDASGREVASLRRMTSKRVRPEAPLGQSAMSSAAAIVAPEASPTVVEATDTTADIRTELRRILGRHLGVPAASVDPGAGFFALGLQSAPMLSILKEIETSFAQRLSPTLLFEYSNISEIADYLRGRGVLAHSRTDAAVKTESEGVAAQRVYVFHESDALVRDHLVYGKPALMGVAHPCMALDFALASAMRRLPMALEQIVFNGGPITPGALGRIEVQVRLYERGDTLDFKTGHVPADSRDEQTCCTGRFAAPAVEVPPTIDVEALIAGTPALSREEQARLYESVADFTIGPALRTIVAAYAPDASTLITRVFLAQDTSRAPGGAAVYALDPLMLNACYYLRLDAQQAPHERIIVPLAIERMTVFAALPESVVIVTTVRRRRAGFVSFDATLYSDQGACLARLENASMQEVAEPARLANARFTTQSDAATPAVTPSAPNEVIARPADSQGPLDIAIVGLAGRYPQADDLDALWNNLRQGRDCIGEIPAERWDWQDYYEPSAGRGRVAGKWGGFISGVDQFAPLFFGIAPREAAGMDPQERLFLEHCWMALEDAGYTRDGIGRSESGNSRQVGVYVGVMSQEYPLFAAQSRERIGLPTGIGSIANRVSFYCDFHGPSIALDTMCSSSLTAIAMACEALRGGRIDAALAGGVNISVHPNKYLMLSQGGFLSSKGHCEAFGAGGDGYIPGEGVGVAVLKRLEDAERDGDRIYGVIKGAAVNHGGRTSGYTVPSPRAQAEVIERAWREAAVDMRLAGYIEAHGTGTSLGDPIEIAGLAKVFAERAPSRQFCAIGSIKSNLGHCESAAGIAGMTKVLLQMRHGQLVPSLHSTVLNPHIDFANSPFRVQQELSEWPRPRLDDATIEYARLAGVSSFGAGGANAHLVIQEYVAAASSVAEAHETASQPALIVLSAKSAQELDAGVQRLHAALTSGRYAASDLQRIAYTLQVGREAMAERFAVIATSLPELCGKLQAYVQTPAGSVDGVFRDVRAEDARRLARVAADDDMAQTIAAWARKGKLDKLAELWVSGAVIDWNLLYGTQRLRRIGLPGYAFARERCWIDVQRAQTPAPALPSAAEESPKQDSDVLLFETLWTPMPSAVDSRQPPQRGTRRHLCFVSDPKHRVEIARAMQEIDPRGRLIFVERGSANKELASLLSEETHRYAVDWQDRGSFERVFTRIKDALGAVDSLLYLWPLEDAAATRDPLPLLYCLQALASSRLPVKKVLLAGECAGETSLDQCYQEAWIGLARSMRFVLRDTQITVLLQRLRQEQASNPRQWNTWVTQIWQELRASGGDAVLYDEDVRHASTLRPLSPAVQLPALPLKQRGTYVITGGLGDLGLAIAEYLAHTASANLVMIGRSALNAERQAALDSLQVLGGRAIYLQVDIRDASRLRVLLAQARTEFGDIHGVIHAAGVAGRTPFERKMREEFERVLGPKIQGTMALDEVLQDQPLDFACYFSSTSAVLGDFGAGDYALANRFQLAYAAYRRLRNLPGRTVAIAWPLWKEGGMDFGTSEGRAVYLQTSGQRQLETGEGIALMCRLLAHGAAQPIVLAGDADRIASALKRSMARGGDAASPATAVRRPSMRDLSIQQCVEWDLRQVVSELLKIPRHQLGLATGLADFGFDSMTLQDFATRLSGLYGVEVAATLFFSHSSLGALSEYFVAQHADTLQRLYGEDDGASELARLAASITPPPAQQHSVPRSTSLARPVEVQDHAQDDAKRDAIAIIGMSGRFPGARDVGQMWELLAQGRDAVTEIPPERFDWRSIYAADAVPGDGRTNCKWSGMLEGAAEFDALFFEVSPREAASIDPRQRLLLTETYRALEDAGCGVQQLRGSIGMFVGAEQGGYGTAADEKEGITANHDALLGARIAHFLDFSGPVMTLNTACSSGLVAAHQACMSLRARECDIAVAAGVNLLLTPESFIGMSRAGMLSPDGRCHAFARNANGMVPGEAVVAVVFKRLADAEADGNPILAVVRGSGINYDGRTNGITAPSGLAQTRLLTGIYRQHGIHADEIGYVIAHGTATALGDPVEINAMCDAFRAQTQRRGYCALTSTKTNFGHTFAASGLVSLVALVQALLHRTLPPSLNCEQPSDLVAWSESPFYVNTGAASWRVPQERARVGAVSAFGMSGTNAHFVLQEYMALSVTAQSAKAPAFLLTLSAKQPEALVRKARDLAAFLRAQPACDLDAVSHTLLNGRQHFRSRCAIVVRDADDAIELLGCVGAPEKAVRLFTGTVSRDFAPTTALQRYGEELLRNAAVLRTDASKWGEALGAFGDLYCQGYDFEWSRLFGAQAPRRVRLPVYPFATDCYWRERRTASAPVVAAHAATSVTAAPVQTAQEIFTESPASAVSQLIANQLGLPLARMGRDVPLDEYGLDSIGATVLVGRIRRLLPTVIDSLFLEHPTLAAIEQHLADKHAVELASLAAKAGIAHAPARAVSITPGASTPAVAARRSGVAKVAVIGMAGQFPGAPSIDEFWPTLVAGKSVVGPMPQRRRQLLGLRTAAAESYHGGYLDGIEFFDHERFKLSRDEAKAMDPQMRKLLEIVWLAVADAGYSLPDFKTRRTALYVAARGPSGYRDIPAYLRHGGRAAEEVESPGLYANRVSNILDLRGPSQSVDTGCSSFLVALRHALADLRDGRCTQAVVATVQMALSPVEYVAGSTSSLYTSSGATRSFAKDSDGYVRAEVCGALVLKLEETANADGDAVYCTLRSVGVHHGGKSPLKWYSPNVEGQKTAIREALREADIDPDTVDYVEPEANGSQLGDASEIIALQAVYGEQTKRDATSVMAISSLKPVFGHAESGSTFPALLKVMLALRECRIPGTVGLGELNEGIQLAPGFEILRGDRAWPRRNGSAGPQPRRAAVHSLALGGVNAHLIVEEPWQESQRHTIGLQGDQVLVFSDRSPELLKATVARWVDYCSNTLPSDELTFESAAYTLQTGRAAEKHRLAVVADSLEAACGLLQEWLSDAATSERIFASKSGGEVGRRSAAAKQDDAAGADASPADLARAWVAGRSIDWRATHEVNGRSAPRRAHLPANVLKQVYCWHDEVAAEEHAPNAGVLLLRPQWVKRVLSSAEASPALPNRVVFCGWLQQRADELGRSLEVVATLPAAAGAPAQHFANYSRSVFELVKRWLTSGETARSCLQVVIPNGLENVCLHALAGLIRTARREHSQFHGQVIVLDHKVSAAQCRESLLQDARHPEDIYIQHINGERWVQSWQELSADAVLREQAAATPFRSAEPVVLITGGAGALGMTLARRLLVEQPRATVFLAGRSPLNAAQERALEQLRSRQHRIRYLRADVSDSLQVHALLDEIRNTAGDCSGIWHCAGAIRDAHIVNKPVEDLETVFGPKVAGLWHLDEATRNMDLEFFVVFSSVAAIFGNAGQADYSMANAFMDAFAAYRNELVRFGLRRGRTISINWPLWADGGMRVSAEVIAAMVRDHSMHPLPSELGARIALGCLRASESHIAVTYGEPDKLRRNLALT